MEDSDIRKDLKHAITAAMLDEKNGQPCGCIVEAGCEARLYIDPVAAADAFINDAVDRVLKMLGSYDNELLNDLAADEDADVLNVPPAVKPLGVAGHLRMIRQRTVEAYDKGTLTDAKITPELIARWRAELEKSPA